MNFKNGFTLAEVLITLVIIGIIAAMTIPSLMNKTNEQETVVAVKKAYSILNQAYQRMVAENGEINPATLDANYSLPSETFGKMLAKQLNTQKVCGMSEDGDCFPEGLIKFLNGTELFDYNKANYCYKIRLNDGMSVSVVAYNSYFRQGTIEALHYMYGVIDVDINGNKGPFTYGKDVFSFYITKYGIVPRGTPGDGEFSLGTCRDVGLSCTAWVTTKGNMDYLRKRISW